MKFLVKASHLGDLAASIPFFRVVARNGHSLDVIAEKGIAGLLVDSEKIVNAVYPKHSRGKNFQQLLFYTRLLGRNWDVIVNLNPGSVVFSLFARLCRPGQYRTLRTPVDRSHLPHFIYHRLSLLDGIIDDWLDPIETAIEYKPERLDEAIRIIGMGSRSRYLTIAPGSANKEKMWSSDKFVEVINQIRSRFDEVVIVGSPAEAKLCQDLAGSCDVKCAAGKISLIETVALVSNASLHIGNDSGLGHVAAANRVSVLAIGVKDPIHCPWKQFMVPGVAQDISVKQVLETIENLSLLG